jgi:pyruvate dehydrogenase E1 component alpha subunit
VGDISREYYRSKQEERLWATERDPIKLLSNWLVANKHADAATLDNVHAELKSEMQKAVEFAIAAPYPSADKASEDVYA